VQVLAGGEHLVVTVHHDAPMRRQGGAPETPAIDRGGAYFVHARICASDGAASDDSSPEVLEGACHRGVAPWPTCAAIIRDVRGARRGHDRRATIEGMRPWIELAVWVGAKRATLRTTAATAARATHGRDWGIETAASAC